MTSGRMMITSLMGSAGDVYELYNRDLCGTTRPEMDLTSVTHKDMRIARSMSVLIERAV